MAFEQTAIILIICAVLVLFMWGKWRYDLVALAALFAAAILGLVPNDKLFSGFGHPATITVAIVLILSYGLTKSGAVEGITHLISPLAHIPSLHIAALIFIAGFLSMFMNNVGALALLMPVAIQSTVKAGRPPATVLMPLSFGSILGGLVTLIGTPPNIIIASYREQTVGEAFSMFDFSPVGGIVAIVGIVFMALIGWRFVKVRKASAGIELFDIEGYLFEVKLAKTSPLTGNNVSALEEILSKYNIDLISLIHKKEKFTIVPKKHTLIGSDILLLEGSQEDIDSLVSKYGLRLLSAENARDEILHSPDTTTMEVIIAPGSNTEDKTAGQIGFKRHLGVNLLAVSRQGRSYKRRLKAFTFKAGDVLLLHGEQEDIEDAISKMGCYPLAERKLGFGIRKKALPALAIFILAITATALGVIPLQVSLGVAVVAMVLLNIVPIRELYDGIDWPVIVLLGAMIPIGNALEDTGTTKLLADTMMVLAGDISPVIIIALLLIITMTLSDVLNNAATAILMAPIAKNIALALGASIDPFLMAVAIGASCAFLTPIGHQNNALILGPGGYHFGDYWRIGLPLEILITLVAVPLLLVFWPL